MGKYVVLIALFCISLNASAQNNTNIEDRARNLFFKVGSDYRITPIYQSSVNDEDNILTSIDSQSSGAAIFYGVEFFPWKQLSLNFNHSFHYTLFYLKSGIEIEAANGTAGAKNEIFMDFHFYINYYIKVFKESEVFIRLGTSMLNRNSNYTSKTSFYQNGEYIGTISGQRNFNMQAYNFGLGYKKDKVEVLLGIYSTSETPYFVASQSFIIPYANLAYTIGKM